MNKTTDLAGTIIRSAASGLSGLATERLLERVPSADTAFRQPFESWKQLFQAQLEDLAGTLAVDRPHLFAAQAQEQQAVSASRGVSPEVFQAAFRALREVLVEKLSPVLAAQVASYVDRALATLATPLTRHESPLTRGRPYSRVVTEYLLEVLQGERNRAWQVVQNAAAEGASLEEVFLYVLAPAQAEIGRMWMQDEANVAEEHFVSSTTKWVMTQLQQLALRQPLHGKTFLAAGVAGNRMDVGLQMLGDLFEIDGWRVVPLGADVPAEDLAQAADFYEVDVVGLSVSMNTQFPALQQAIRSIRGGARGERVKILVGGRAFELAADLAAELGADAVAQGLVEARSLARQLTGLPANPVLHTAFIPLGEEG